MKFHTDKLTRLDFVVALAEAQTAREVGPEVTFTDFNARKSLCRDVAFEVKLGYFDWTAGRTNRRQNAGGSGSREHVPFAATYSEWGAFLTRLFERDPALVVGSKKYGYNGVADFHMKTSGKFDMGAKV